MNQKPIKGVICLIPTIFDKKGNLDLEGFRENIRIIQKSGIHGIVIGASVGQYYLLNEDEYKQIVNVARDECKEMLCLVGTHHQNTRDTILRTKYAEYAGVDGAFILPPYYSNFMDSEACYAHYKTVHDATSEIQLMLYNYEAAGFLIDITLWERLLKACPRITAVKECTPLIEFGEVVRKYQGRINVLAGAEFYMYPTMLMGGVGSTPVYAAAFPKFMLQFYDACANERWEEALAYHNLVCSYVGEFRRSGITFDIKGIYNAAGLIGGFQRPPFISASDKDNAFHKVWIKRFNEFADNTEKTKKRQDEVK